ncbi:MAG: 50S ribosomal protein L18 [Dehalococcoidia bacterium]|nr:50S ribosomal protein L18 [Dehalococcoidia bacterium]
MTKKNPTFMRKLRHERLRKKVHGSASRPRLAVFRSLKYTYVQVIDDDRGHTLASASTRDTQPAGDGEKLTKTQVAGRVGATIAERALACGVKQVVFDRGGFDYHGRVKAIADEARKGGLEF